MIGKKLQKALGLAVEELKRRRHEYLTLEHVLYGIASEPSGRKLIERCGGSAPVLRQALDHFFKTYMESLDEPTKDVYQTLAVQRVLDSALAHVKSAGRDEDIGVEVGDVLAAILEEEEYSWAAYCLKKQGITRLAVLESISHNDEEGQDESSSESGEGEGGAESAKDALARYTVDLTARARAGKIDPVIGRDTEIRNAIRILSRKSKSSPGAVRTIRCTWAIPGPGRPPLRKVWPCASSAAMCRRSSRIRRYTPLISGPCSPGRATAATSKAASRPWSERCRRSPARSCLLTKSILLWVPVPPAAARWTLPTC